MHRIVILSRGRVDDLSFFDYLSPFCLLLIEFHCIFSYLIKYCNILFIIIILKLGCNIPSVLIFFVSALLLSILTPFFLPSSSVSLSYFVLAVPMSECLGKQSCMRSPFPIAILNGTCFFPTVQLQVHTVYSKRKIRNLRTSIPMPLKLN